ncbi:MAG: HAD hydrolase-like protein [Pseudomonadota bacterium]
MASDDSYVLFFDLDGTLTDPKVGITRCIQYALAQLGQPTVCADDLEWCIGPPLKESLATLVGAANADQAIAHYRERFADIGWAENEPYAGIHDALEDLTSRGAQMFVATSKPAIYAEKILAHFDLDRFFTRLYGAELDGRYSDKAELLAWARSEHPTPMDAMMIGDRRHDIRGARANGMQAIGVSYGYGSCEELADAGADRIVHSPQALRDLIVP